MPDGHFPAVDRRPLRSPLSPRMRGPICTPDTQAARTVLAAVAAREVPQPPQSITIMIAAPVLDLSLDVGMSGPIEPEAQLPRGMVLTLAMLRANGFRRTRPTQRHCMLNGRQDRLWVSGGVGFGAGAGGSMGSGGVLCHECESRCRSDTCEGVGEVGVPA